MEERYYVITAVAGFDGTTPCPTVGWENQGQFGQNHGKYNRLVVSTPVGVFSPEVLGRGRGRGSASLVRVWCNGPLLETDVWRTRASSTEAEGTPINVFRESPSLLSLNPADSTPKELGPTDDLVVAFEGGGDPEEAATITIAVVDLSADEYREWTRVKWLAAQGCGAGPTREVRSVTVAGALTAPVADITIYNLSVAAGSVILLPSPAIAARQQLAIVNVGTATAQLRAAAGHTVNGVSNASNWRALNAGEGTLLRPVDATRWAGTKA